MVSDVVTLGETMALLTTPRVGRLRDMPELLMGIAGSESNVAIGICRLGYRASWIGRVGADEFGELILASLRREGVDVAGSVVDGAVHTAIMFKERRTPAVSRVTYYREGYAGSRLGPEDLDESLIGAARIVHVTGITLALSKTARAAAYRAVEIGRAAGALISFDFNYRAALWPPDEAARSLRDMALRSDLVFASDDEVALLGGEDPISIAQSLTGGGERAVIVKRGAKGAVSVRGADIHDEPALAVTAIDVVGAGDAFVAGYLAGVLDGAAERDCLRLGCATGAHAVTVLGDWEGLPSRDDLVLLQHAAGTTLR
jgi:2-dehydro-3-deoxygluconokinase